MGRSKMTVEEAMARGADVMNPARMKWRVRAGDNDNSRGQPLGGPTPGLPPEVAKHWAWFAVGCLESERAYVEILTAYAALHELGGLDARGRAVYARLLIRHRGKR